MIAFLKKISFENGIIIYAYSYENGPLDGLIKIDLTKDLVDVTLATGDVLERMAKNAVGKILRWHDENKLPDEYEICIG